MARNEKVRQVLKRSCNYVSKVKSVNKIIMLITSLWDPQCIWLHKEFRLLLRPWLQIHNVITVKFIWTYGIHIGFWVWLGDIEQERTASKGKFKAITETGWLIKYK